MTPHVVSTTVDTMTEERATGLPWPVLDRQVADVLTTRSCDPSLTVLAETQALQEVTAARVRLTVAHARRRGYTWEQIGAALGVTRQGAQKRYGADPTPPPTRPGP